VYLSDAERHKLDALLRGDPDLLDAVESPAAAAARPPGAPAGQRSSRAADMPELRLFVLFRAGFNGRDEGDVAT
jgi:hypothetical protein